MNQTGLRRILPDQSSGSGQTFGTPRHPNIKDPILSKRVCFYKSGDPQFNGLRMVINNRTFKTFDALLDSLSKKVPLPFGVRNITTPQGVHAIYNLDELEDGKSYICSDSRKVKPINLALARRKLPPWYHARPVSSRRRTVQQARFFPGQNIHKQELVVMRTPKRLLVFRNGDPTIKHTVVLHKRTKPTFESILEYISELMQFHVVKLHTPDGKRVDGLPGLILCSGTVVAAGREPFRSANYNTQKSPAPTRLPNNRMGLRRLKSLNRKKKSLSHSSKSRNFSPSSERYIVNQIHSSIAESSCDLPSNPTNSVELESSHILESVAETEGDTCLRDGAEGQGCLQPTEDDIEKSFRVNEDGSMTVEMRVRLTIKEEETIHWTTTLTRSSVANQLNASCLPEPEAEQDICSPKSQSMDLQSPAASIDSINKDKPKDNNDEDPPSLSNGSLGESSNEEDNIKIQADVLSPRRAPTPGHKQIRKKQTSVDSIKSLMVEGIQEEMVGSYSYKEQIENGPMTEQHCMFKQSTTRPVPKPRRLGSVDANSINSRNVSTFKSTGMTEILQIESSGEEVTETVLHIYEQQTCQDNFLANICARGMSASGISFGRPATSETGQLSSTNEFEPELWRPSTASESIRVWRAENMSVTSDLTLPSLRTGAIQATNGQQQFPKYTKGKDEPQPREVIKGKRVSSKAKVINKRIRRLWTPGKRQKENSTKATETRKKVKTFSSAGFIKRIYGNKSKSATNTNLKKKPTQNSNGGVTTKSLQPSDETIKNILKEPDRQLKENSSQTVSLETSRPNVSPTKVRQPRGILTWQTSMHQEKNENKTYDIDESMTLPAFNSSSSVTHEYVENWLEKAYLNPTSNPDEERKKLKTESGKCGESGHNYGLITVAEEGKLLEKNSVIQPSRTLKSDPLPESVLENPVKLRIQCFENKSSSPSVEKTTVTQQGEIAHATTTNTENCISVAQNTTEEIKPLLNGICSEIYTVTKKTSTEMPSRTIVENKSSPIKISLQKASHSKMISMELPPPPPPAEVTELSNTEYCVMDASSVASSPLCRFSSVSIPMSDHHPLSISPTSDKAISPTGHATETTTSVQTEISSMLREAPLPRTPSIKRAALVSNLSFERKMSLRKACLDKYTLCSDATADTTTSSTPISTVGDDDNVLPNGICSTGTQLPPEKTRQSNSILDLKSSPSCCTSASPTSLTSGERMSSASISSSEAPTPSDIPFKETKTTKTQFLSQKELSSPKPLGKRGKLISSPSPDRKPQTKKLSYEHANDSSLHNHHAEKTILPNIRIQEHATPSASPSTERKKMLYNPKLQKRLSPYSQSLDVVSPPVRNESSRKMLPRNQSSDNASEPVNKIQRKTSSPRKLRQTSQSIKSPAELDKTLISETLMLEASQIDKNTEKKTNDLTNADQEKSMTEEQLLPQPLNIANQPNMKPVLERICYSIKSIRQITQNKHPSCLEKSNSLPDFSSHVASTFGSSSKALLAFLSVLTLKEGITNFHMDELNANNVSCAEALKMIDSLREIASIEDSHKLKASLSNLQHSTSKQLLQSWKGFQELSNNCKSRSSTPNHSEEELITKASPEKDCVIEENVIDEIMDNLDIPEKLKEELASLSIGVKSESDDADKMSARFMGKVALSPKDNSDSKLSGSSTEDTVNVRDVTHDEKANVDVSSIVKKITNIKQPIQSDIGSIPLITEAVKHKLTDQAPKDKDGQYRQNVVAKCPQAEPNDKQTPEERKLHNTVLYVEEDREALNSCEEEYLGEKKQHQGHIEDKYNQETANMNGVVNSTKNLENKSPEVECRQLQMQSEESMSIPEKDLTSDDESGSDEEGQNILSANKDVEQKESCKKSVSSSGAGEQNSSEEEQPEVECEEAKQERSECEDLSYPDSHSEDEEDKQLSCNNYVELNVSRKKSISSPVSENQFLSEEEQCRELSNKDTLSYTANLVKCEKEAEIQKSCMGLNVSVDESTGNSDVDERASSEEEQPEVVCKELQETEESLSGPEEDKESIEEEEHLDNLPDHEEKIKTCKKLKALIEETEEDKVSSDDEDNHTDKEIICDTKCQNNVHRDLINLIENQESYIKKDNRSLIKSDSLEKPYRSDADEDSWNVHSCCEEQVEVEQPKVADEQIISSIEEELSYYEKESSSEEEQANMDRYIGESCTEYQDVPALATQLEVTKCENVEKVKHQSEEIISQSVAKRVNLLEKQVVDTEERKNVMERPVSKHFSQRNAHLESDVEDSSSESPGSSQSALCARSAPQSSLSFSYDSSGVTTTEPEGNRVRSIREMFLAKSAKDIQHGHRRFSSSNASELSELRAETSASRGYQSQTSSEHSSGEDDSARKSITKGFVKRTIERLYGKKDANPDEEAGEKPPSAPNQKKKEHSSILSPFHIAQSKAMSELSYFNSTNALDTLSEATRCIAFNAQVGPGDNVPIDNGQWLFRENTPIRKSVSDPVRINKACEDSPLGEGKCEDTEQNTPYSLFSTKSELEDKTKSLSRKCTYFSLPHASDSDVCQDDLSTVSKSNPNGDSITDTKDNSEDTKVWAERNGTLPAVGVIDFKMMDNKVHPLIEVPSDGEVVVMQPGKGHGVMNRRLQEPDMLDLLYNFCGQHCPIL